MPDLISIPSFTKSGEDASKGTPNRVGATYFATDTGIMYVATGTASEADWESIIKLPTVAGQMLYATGAGTFNLLNAGSNGQILTLAAGIPVWANPGVAGTKKLAKVSGYASATIMTSNTSGAHSWNAEDKDNDGMVDLGTDDTVVTIKTAGDYHVITFGKLQMPGSGSIVPQIYNRLNATGFGRYWGYEFFSSDNDEPAFLLHDIVTCAVNDEIDLYIEASADNNLSASGVAQGEWGMIVKEV